ncbi:MAG: hypothetical protein GEU28_04365 [Dehalococcoidia bacterium]|nr:hypothetical protein [Dehalococcoidia bacterium]
MTKALSPQARKRKIADLAKQVSGVAREIYTLAANPHHGDRRLQMADLPGELLGPLAEEIVVLNPRMLSATDVQRSLFYDLFKVYWPPAWYQDDSRVQSDLGRVAAEAAEFIQSLVDLNGYSDLQLPVVRLGVDEPVAIGNVTLRPISQAEREGWWEDRPFEIYGTSEDNVDSVAVVKSPGTESAAIASAQQNGILALDLVRAMGTPSCRRSCFALMGHSPEPRATAIAWGMKDTFHLAVGAALDIGYWRAQDLVDAFGRDRFLELQGIVGDSLQLEPGSKAMRDRVVQGLAWLGKANRPGPDPEHALELSIALEFLIGGEPTSHATHQSITAMLCERAALLVGDDYAGRRATHDMIRELYDGGSGIRHASTSRQVTVETIDRWAVTVWEVARSLVREAEEIDRVGWTDWVLKRRYRDLSGEEDAIVTVPDVGPTS